MIYLHVVVKCCVSIIPACAHIIYASKTSPFSFTFMLSLLSIHSTRSNIPYYHRHIFIVMLISLVYKSIIAKYLLEQLLKLSTGLGFKKIITATNVLLVDKDVGNGTLTGFFTEVVLDGGTVINFVQFNTVKLGETLESFLCATAESYALGILNSVS